MLFCVNPPCGRRVGLQMKRGTGDCFFFTLMKFACGKLDQNSELSISNLNFAAVKP